jgi:hypothetical protein
MPISSTITSSAVSKFFRNLGRVEVTSLPQTITLSNPHADTNYVAIVWTDSEDPFNAKSIAGQSIVKVSGSQLHIVWAWYGFSTCGYTSSNVGTTERFDDITNSHTSRADATARHSLAGYSMQVSGTWYGFGSCGHNGSAYVGTTERFDDVANSHTPRAVSYTHLTLPTKA